MKAVEGSLKKRMGRGKEEGKFIRNSREYGQNWFHVCCIGKFWAEIWAFPEFDLLRLCQFAGEKALLFNEGLIFIATPSTSKCFRLPNIISLEIFSGAEQILHK